MDFILVPDALFASEARFVLAQQPTIGARVGSFQVLLDTLTELWVIEKPADTWAVTLQEKALSMTDAFWAKSIKADERTTIEALTRSLKFMLDHRLLARPLTQLQHSQGRQQLYYNDLVRLQQEISLLPFEQQIAENWLEASAEVGLESLHVYPLFDINTLLPWQQSIIQCLQQKGWLAPQVDKYANLLPPVQSTDEAIDAFNQRLFNGVAEPLSLPRSALKWLTCRDAAQEAEATAAMLQQAIKTGIQPFELAVVVPKKTMHSQWLGYYLNQAGLAVSNLRLPADLFDWQAELIQNLLSHLLKPDLRMSMQSVLINPVMPWDASTGYKLADKYKRAGSLFSTSDSRQALLLAMLGRHEKAVTSSDECIQWLQGISDLLSYKSVVGLSRQRMSEILLRVQHLFSLYDDQEFEQQLLSVLKQISVASINLQGERQRYLNAVITVEEDEVLPIAVKHLYVLGFNSGHYEYKPAKTGALTRYQWDALSEEIAGSVQIPNLHKEQQRWQQTFKSLLGTAQRKIVFMRSLVNSKGALLEPSETLFDIALCYQAINQLDPAALEQSVFADALLPVNERVNFESAEITVPDALDMHGSLLGRYVNNDGSPRHESPSSLDTMMLSPLAWLLGRLRIESQVWEVASLQPHIAGTIAHQVFEEYAAIQDEPIDEACLAAFFEKSVQEHAAFLNAPAFTMAKQDLFNSVSTSLAAFDEWLQQDDWKVAKVEITLEGKGMFGITVKGKADAVLIAGDDVLILDYKKSSHKERLKRLEKGYELQTALYRDMYKSTFGQPKGILSSGYCTLNDQVLLTDYVLNPSPQMHVKSATNSLNEQSVKAQDQVRNTLDCLRAGQLVFNSSDDIRLWQSRGVSVYALTDNRLVQRFTVKADGKEAE